VHVEGDEALAFLELLLLGFLRVALHDHALGEEFLGPVSNLDVE